MACKRLKCNSYEQCVNKDITLVYPKQFIIFPLIIYYIKMLNSEWRSSNNHSMFRSRDQAVKWENNFDALINDSS